MTGNTQIFIKDKGAYIVLTSGEQQRLCKVEFNVPALPAVMFPKNGSGADPVSGFLSASHITRNLYCSLFNSKN